jgi:hypothetical protein
MYDSLNYLPLKISNNQTFPPFFIAILFAYEEKINGEHTKLIKLFFFEKTIPYFFSSD